MGSIEKAIEFKAMTFPNTSTDIPDELLPAQEEGRVVFFCGAGISYDAGEFGN